MKNNKVFLLLIVLVFLSIASRTYDYNLDSEYDTSFLINETDSVTVSTVCIMLTYPITSDKCIVEFKKKYNCTPFVYPLLVINNIAIRDKEKIDYFRNNFYEKIKKIKRVNITEAEKLGFTNIPKDGVLFVTLKKGCYIDFSCE